MILKNCEVTYVKLIKRIKLSFERKFEGKPVIGNVIYGIFTGFVVCTCLLLFVIIFAVLTGLHSTLGINYKSWRLFMMLSLVVALIAFVLGAFAYFPYRRQGNSLFKKEYVNGTSYRALHSILKSQERSDKSEKGSDDFDG